MEWKRAEAFVLRSIPLGEADRIVNLFTREEGLVRAVAKGARKSRKRFGGSLEPLTRVQARYFQKEGADLGRLESCEILESHFILQQSSLEIIFCFSYLVELVGHFAREREADPRFFRLLSSILEAAESAADPVLLVRYFEIWTLRLHGLLPEFRNCGGCQEALEGIVAYHLVSNELLCPACLRRRQGESVLMKGTDWHWIRKALAKGPLEVCRTARRPLPGPGLRRFTRSAIEGFLERPLRTYRFLPTEYRV